ncbi:uncharacterized protein LOC115999427 [Ipomoea triloba]|uniref:uncharacterized protein LOC115999427 n=1 Tax=Ipomoea triloba TaxID=35885 RepID=UPI00125CEA24|nr:uncharacterized protein LOC115999427 [Ipomoea triloba]
MESVELVIHHGGNFVKDSEQQYINGEVWEVDIDPDLLSCPHLVKFIKEGMLFEDASQFKNAMIKYAVHFKRDIYFYKNESMRVRIKCVEGCPFVCHCSWEERYRCFQLKTCLLEHRCNCKYKLKLVTQKWLEEKYEDIIIKDPTMQHTKLRDHIQTDLKINLTISMVRRAQRAVLERVNLGYSEQFKRIRDYAQECLNSNPRSTVLIKTTRVVPTAPCTFHRLYVCFQAMKRGFLDGCRPIIGLDGCFLKGVMKGELLAAVGRDSNNQMYPIAWAVVEIENTDSWKWFLQLLIQDLGINNSWNWTVISDQQKCTCVFVYGLVHVIQELLPNVEHRHCARQIHANWSKKHRGKLLKKHFEQQTMVEQLRLKDAQAKQDLENYPAKFWCKAFMRTEVKCDSVDNNMCEAFDGTIVKPRSKPIVKMLEDVDKDCKMQERCRQMAW